MIGTFNIHFWLAWVYAVALAGALYPKYDFAIVLVSVLVLALFNMLALSLAWKNRKTIEKLKPLSDGVAIVGISLFVVMLFVGGLTDSLIWLLAFIQLALSLTFKEERQFHYSLIVSFFLLLAGAAESKTGFYLFFIVFYCAVTSICLGIYFIDRRLRQNQGIRQSMNWPVLHRVKVIILLVGMSFLVYLIIPRFEAANFGSKYGASEEYYHDQGWEREADNQTADQQTDMPDSGPSSDSANSKSNTLEEALSKLEEDNNQQNNQSSGQTGSGREGGSSGQGNENFQYRGFSDSFDIRGDQKEGEIPPNVIVAYMRARQGAYLKVETFDLFDGVTWHKSLQSDNKRKLRFGEITLVRHIEPNYRQNITIEENLGAYLPAAAIPVQLAFPSTVISIDPYQMIKIPASLNKGTSYTVDSRLHFINNRLFSGDHYQPRASDLQLPQGIDKRIRGLAEQVSKGAASEFEKAEMMEKHLRENYKYSYESIFNSQNKTPLGRFLFDDKKGHCEYFASSMVVMLRTLGIRTRLVTGFSATVANPLTGYYEIRVLDGHAWVEAWVDNLGWAVFEPTPFYTQPLPDDKTTSVEKIQEYVDQLEKIQNQSGGESEISLEKTLVATWQSLSEIVVVLLSYLKLVFLQSWKGLIAVVALLAGVWILWRRWQPVFLKRLSYLKVMAHKPDEPKASIRFYMKHIQYVTSMNGTVRNPGTTIEQYLTELDDATMDNQTMQKVILLVNQSHYNTDLTLEIDPVFLKQVFLTIYHKQS